MGRTVAEFTELVEQWESLSDADIGRCLDKIRQEETVISSETHGNIVFEKRSLILKISGAEEAKIAETLGLRFTALKKRARDNEIANKFRTRFAKENAAKSKEKNPEARAKVEAKVGALALWKERYAGKHPKLRRVEDFAMEVMRRWPVLTSADVIRRWSAKWSKQVRNGETPTL